MFNFTSSVCVICRASLQTDSEWVTVTAKGADTLLQYSRLRCDDELSDYLLSTPASVNVHRACRKQFTNKRRFEQQLSKASSDESAVDAETLPPKVLRSSSSFNWKCDCFLCGETAIVDIRHPERCVVRSVQTLTIHTNMIQVCRERNDSWALEVQGRLETCSDLVAAEAVYHATCHRSFCCVKYSDTELGCSAGRPEDSDKYDSFRKICDHLEAAEDQLYSVSDLLQILQDMGETGEVAYSFRHLKRKLEEAYGNHIFFAEVSGRRNVICFRDMASHIITDKWYSDRQSCVEDDSQRIVVAAAKLIRAQIREAVYSQDIYPASSDFNDTQKCKNWIPSLLRQFMDIVVSEELKQVSISHSIVQGARPRSAISPVLFGVGVSLDHAFGSRWLVDMLSRIGFSISYDEVKRYKQSVVHCSNVDTPESFPSCFTQWSADNVDHNINTLDGKGSFHGMGIISMSTPLSRISSGHFSAFRVPRLQRVNVDKVIANQGIDIKHYNVADKNALSTISFKPMSDLFVTADLHLLMDLDLVWHASWFFHEPEKPRPNWSGFMQDVCAPPDTFHPAADIRMLPIIDMNPNDMSCIYSTLCFIEQQAQKLNMPTACVTFDQPLWLKAVEIVRSSNMNVVCRLGSFHVIMSFLGSIGTIMAGSGLVEALHCCYGPGTVAQMMTGKSVSRAVRGHIMAESSLVILLLRDILQLADQAEAEPSVISREDVDHLKRVCNDIEQQNCDNFTTVLSGCLMKLKEAIYASKLHFSEQSRTAKLWVQYMNYVTLLKAFIRAERTSDWTLHLQTLSRMLNLFAASGHCHYTKSGRLYLQLMLDLPETHPWLHEQLSRRHAVRRSDRFWAGLSTDLTIEQVMMRAVKSRGGLTRGRGMTESVRLLWVRSMHSCATVYSALSCLSNLDQQPQDMHHVEMGKSRMQRDFDDVTKLVTWFESHNPFAVGDGRLFSLSSGITASEGDGVNCDAADDVGGRIMQKLDAVPFTDIVLKKSDQAKTLAHISNKVIGGDRKLPVDAAVLFDRLLLIMQRCSDIENFFSYELTAVPTSLFKDGCLRKANKSLLAKELTKGLDSADLMEAKTYVVDGGWLLHRVKWQQFGTFGDVFKQYIRYVHAHYGTRVTVVFDGYCNGPTIKDHEHSKRAVRAAPDVSIDDDKPVYSNQSAFLANEENKNVFVSLLVKHFHTAGCAVLQAQNDADTLIVDAALKISRNDPVTVIGNDTDLLVLLVYHFHNNLKDIFLCSEVTKHRSPSRSLISIRDLCANLGPVASHQLLVLHAIGGCDTTSALYGIGKGVLWKKINKSKETGPLCEVLESESASHEDVAVAGLKLMALLYGGKLTNSLNHLRYIAYMNLIASSTSPPRPERLPPTENAAQYHVYRAHLQAVLWKSLMLTDINPVEWGWKLNENRYVPVATDSPAAPDELLNVVRCKCKLSSRRLCTTQLCSCIKHGLSCVAACKHCNGEQCLNSEVRNSVGDSDDDDEEEQLPSSTFDAVADVFRDSYLDFDIPYIEEEIVDERQNKERYDVDNAEELYNHEYMESDVPCIDEETVE